MLAHRTLLPVVLALVSVAAVGCAAPTAEESAPSAPTDESAEAGGEHAAIALSGSAGMNAPSRLGAASVDGLAAAHAATDVIGELAVKETGALYDLLSYDFTIEAGTTTFSATGGLSVAPPKVSAVQVRVRARGKAPALGNGAFSGKTSTFTLSMNATAGTKALPFLLAEYAYVSKATTEVTNDGVVETVDLAPRAITLTRGKAQVKIDPMLKTAGGPAPLPPACTTSAGDVLPLGGFAVAPAGSVPKGTTPVDAIDVQVSKVTTTSPTGGAATSTLKLDTLAASGALGTSALCAVAQAATGRAAATFSAEVDVASIDGAVPQTRWEACVALPKAVHFEASAAGASERVELTAGGLVRTDWTYDAFSGTELGKTVSGWSFLTNAPATTCAP